MSLGGRYKSLHLTLYVKHNYRRNHSFVLDLQFRKKEEVQELSLILLYMSNIAIDVAIDLILTFSLAKRRKYRYPTRTACDLESMIVVDLFPPPL